MAHYRVKIPNDARGPIRSRPTELPQRSRTHTAVRLCGDRSPVRIRRSSERLTTARVSFDQKDIPKNVSGQITDHIPNVPIVIVAQATAQIPLGDGKTPTQWKPVILKSDRERWNDWGIGMLLQGDIKGAEYAFNTVTQAEPEYSDGWLNAARAMIKEGETDAAKPYIQKAIALNPSAGRSYFFRAMVERRWRLSCSDRVAEPSFDRSARRVALNQLARILVLSREYAESLKVLAEVARSIRRICRCITRDARAPRRGNGRGRAGGARSRVQGRGVGAGDPGDRGARSLKRTTSGR